MKVLLVEMPDGTWQIPVAVIARHRAAYYATDFDGDVARSLAEDTEPLFAADSYEVEDWATNNMDWVDVAPHARRVATTVDHQAAWSNAAKSVCEVPEQLAAPDAQVAGLD